MDDVNTVTLTVEMRVVGETQRLAIIGDLLTADELAQICVAVPDIGSRIAMALAESIKGDTNA